MFFVEPFYAIQPMHCIGKNDDDGKDDNLLLMFAGSSP